MILWCTCTCNKLLGSVLYEPCDVSYAIGVGVAGFSMVFCVCEIRVITSRGDRNSTR